MNAVVNVKNGAILGPDGLPIQRRGSLGRNAARLDGAGGFGIRGTSAAYEGASYTNPDLSGFDPSNVSPQVALSLNHDRLAARVHDMARNDGWAGAAFARQVDSVIGSGWRLTAKPNAISLGISPEAADELAINIEAEWRDYAMDADSCDVRQISSMGALLALAFRHRVTDGEALAACLWLDRGTSWHTAVQIIHPDRLSNPFQVMDRTTLRAGVEIGPQYGEPIAYHIRDAHPGDYSVVNPGIWRWERVLRTLPNGRRQIVHAYEATSADMTRGVPPLAPVIQKLHMLGRYDKAELQAAVINAVLAAVVTSPDQTQVKAALEGDPTQESEMSALQEERLDYYGNKPVNIPGAQINYLYPTDKLEFTRPEHPNTAFEAFYRTGLRNIAAATGVTYEQLSMDWSQTNYSSARGALLEVWKGFTARKDNFASTFMAPIYANWLEEAIDSGRVKLPKGAPDFRTRRQAYCQNRWIGPARGWIDPLKEAEAALARLSSGISTYEKECADQGEWWPEVMAQRARERKEMIRLGLDPDLMMRAQNPRGTQPGVDQPPAAPAPGSGNPNKGRAGGIAEGTDS